MFEFQQIQKMEIFQFDWITFITMLKFVKVAHKKFEVILKIFKIHLILLYQENKIGFLLKFMLK